MRTCIDCGKSFSQTKRRMRCAFCTEKNYKEKRAIYNAKRYVKHEVRRARMLRLKNGLTVLNNVLGQTMAGGHYNG